MAKVKTNPEGKKESMSGFFREEIRKHRNLLNDKGSNKILIQKWLDAHPGEPLPKSIRSNLANLKSNMRKKKRGRKRAAAAVLEANSTSPSISIKKVKVSVRSLESLEEAIDDCMTAAKNIDREGLAHVIQALRKARYHVGWKMDGEDGK